MSEFSGYSTKAAAARGLGRFLGVASRNNPDLDVASLIEQVDGKFGFYHDKAHAAVGLGGLDEQDQELKLACGHVNCPHCGIHLSNGLGDYDGLVDRHGEAKAYTLQKHEWSCLGCNGEWGAEIEAPKSKGSKKPTRRYVNKSTVDGAVAKSHEIFNANPDARRKDAIQLAVDAGIAFYTARTQYQKWFKAQKVTRAK